MRTKIDSHEVGTSFITTAVKHNGHYDSFGINKKHAYAYGRKADEVVNVKCTIIEEDIVFEKLLSKSYSYDANKIDYFGLVTFLKDDEMDISLIYPNVKVYLCCFPYEVDRIRFWDHDLRDYDGTIEHHKGDRRAMTVRLGVEEINNEEDDRN